MKTKMMLAAAALALSLGGLIGGGVFTPAQWDWAGSMNWDWAASTMNWDWAASADNWDWAGSSDATSDWA